MGDRKEAHDKLAEGLKQLQDEGGKNYPNMDELPVFTDGIVLANIRNFYERVHEAPKQPPSSGSNGWSPIFTQVGPILIALNPFVHGFPCYERPWQDAFHKAGLRGDIQNAWRRLGPHCFNTIEIVYQDLRKIPQQGVVICGESGAGKTFTNKLMIEYLLDKGCALDRCRARTKSMVMAMPSQDRLPTVSDETKKSVEAANDLLEAFGNAKTGRNDNSSRFGKFTQLFFVVAKGQQVVVSYPKVQTYLLERSRVTSLPDSERSYHIFHYLGQEAAQREVLEDKYKGTQFDYIKGALGICKNEFDKDGKPIPFDDTASYHLLKKQMSDAGFSDQYTIEIFKLISSLMYLGNCYWDDGSEDTQSPPKMTPASQDSFTFTCDLLGLKEAEMKHALTHKLKPVTEDGKLVMKLLPVYTKIQVHAQRDAIAKAVYSLIFDDIVERLNKMLGKGKTSNQGMYIGMLDIFGFEDMPKNGFEQMFINLTNETIQQFFNDVFFNMELVAYEAEGISVNENEVKQNCIPTLDLFGERNKGIIYLLNDQAKAANPQDGEKLVSLFNSKFEKVYDQRYKVAAPGGDSVFKKCFKNKEAKWQARGLKKLPQVDYKECFVIEHYACNVIYTVEDFATKSRDKMESHIVDVLKKSANQQFANLVAPKDADEDDKSSKKDLSVGLKFKESLDSLLTTLKAGPSVFVRCIKPKARNGEPFNVEEVYEQLKTGGVISALHIRSKGYPDRKEYAEFMNEFWPLERGNFENDAARDKTKSATDRCYALLRLFVGNEGNSTYQLGHTKVFMKTGILARLRDAKEIIKVRCCQLVKRKWRAKQVMNLHEILEGLDDRLNDAEVEAEQQEVQEVEAYTKARQAAKDAIKRCDETLNEDTQARDALQAKKEKKVGFNMPRADEQRLVALKDKLEKVVLSAEVKMEALEAVIRKVCDRKCKAQDKIALLMNEKRLQAEELLESVREVSGCCKNFKDPKQKMVFDQCEQVRMKLEKLLNEDLSQISREALAAVDLNVDNPTIELPKLATELVEKAKQEVSATRKEGENLLEAKRKFEHEAYQVEKDLHELRDRAKERLAQLEADSEDAVKCGFTILSEAIDRAERLDEEVEVLRENATDAAAFIAKIKEYLKAEQQAQTACQMVQKLKGEKAQREEVGRKRIFGDFTSAKELLGLYTHFMSQMGDLRNHVGVPDDPDSATDECITRADLQRRLQTVEETLANVNFEGMGTENTSQGIGFMYSGAWSAERFKLLGEEVSHYEGMCKVLDREHFAKIIDAVEALNSGCVTMNDGYCIGWSQTWGRYYFLYTEASEKRALEALAATEGEIKARQKKDKLIGFQNKIKGAIKALGRKDILKTLDEQNESLEKRIKATVQKDLDTAYKAKVIEGVKDRTENLTEKSREQVLEREARKFQMMTEQEKEAHQFEEQIQELHHKLERATVKKGDHGQLPALFTHLLDAESIIMELKGDCGKIIGASRDVLREVQEAVKLADDLAKEPETLPSLKEFVEALSKVQKRHCEAEKLANALGLSGQYPDLKDARQAMTEVAMKVKGVCDGSLTFESGDLAQELAEIERVLQNSMAAFERLEAAFSHWDVRLDNAAVYLQQGMALVDVRSKEMQKIHDIGDPDRKQESFWDKMFSGVMENFCTSDRPLQGRRNGGLRLEGGNGGVARELVRANKEMLGMEISPKSPYQHPATNSKIRSVAPGHHLGIGDVVEDLHTKHLRGIVRFMGGTKFAAGDWIGIELDAPIGKNNGRVNGIEYFRCEDRHGIFMRPASVTKVFGTTFAAQQRGNSDSPARRDDARGSTASSPPTSPGGSSRTGARRTPLSPQAARFGR